MLTDLLSIYQIGDVVVRLENEQWPGYKTPTGGQATAFLYSDSFIWPNLSNGKPTQITIKGDIHPNHLFMLDQTIARLQSLQKRQVKFIAYLDLDECPDPLGEGEDHAFETGLLWLECEGVLLDVDASSTDDVTSISLQVAIGPYWQPLNRLEWEYRSSKYPPGTQFLYTTTVTPDIAGFMSPYVYRGNIEQYYSHGHIWARRNIVDEFGLYAGNYFWDANCWSPLVAERLRMGFPHIGTSGTHPNVITETHTVYPNSTLFNAPPKSIYRLRLYDTVLGLPLTDGTIVFRVNSTYDGWKFTARDFSINVPLMLEAYTAAGLGANFTTDDYLYVGDTFVKPGFFARVGIVGSQLFTEVYPPVFYSGEFPGNLSSGHSTIQYSLVGSTVSGLDYDYIHMFRRY